MKSHISTSSRLIFSCWASILAVAVLIEAPALLPEFDECFRLSFENILPSLMLNLDAMLILWCGLSAMAWPWPPPAVLLAAPPTPPAIDDDEEISFSDILSNFSMLFYLIISICSFSGLYIVVATSLNSYIFVLFVYLCFIDRPIWCCLFDELMIFSILLFSIAF